jgi:tRNA(adenine34) deaminase
MANSHAKQGVPEEDIDNVCMRQCIEIAAKGSRNLDFPFGALVLFKNKVISRRHNEALDKKQVFRHAEMLALIYAQKALTSSQLSQSTFYSSVEPCPMCSFAIQELGISRVVFGLISPVMGGFTKWAVLQDRQINEVFPNTFRHPPEIITGILRDEVVDGWRSWNEEKWKRLVAKGVF